MGDGSIYRASQHARISMGWRKARPTRMGGRYASRSNDNKLGFRPEWSGKQKSRLCQRWYTFARLDERDVLLFVMVDYYPTRFVYVLRRLGLSETTGKLFGQNCRPDNRKLQWWKGEFQERWAFFRLADIRQTGDNTCRTACVGSYVDGGRFRAWEMAR